MASFVSTNSRSAFHPKAFAFMTGKRGRPAGKKDTTKRAPGRWSETTREKHGLPAKAPPPGARDKGQQELFRSCLRSSSKDFGSSSEVAADGSVHAGAASDQGAVPAAASNGLPRGETRLHTFVIVLAPHAPTGRLMQRMPDRTAKPRKASSRGRRRAPTLTARTSRTGAGCATPMCATESTCATCASSALG